MVALNRAAPSGLHERGEEGAVLCVEAPKDPFSAPIVSTEDTSTTSLSAQRASISRNSSNASIGR